MDTRTSDLAASLLLVLLSSHALTIDVDMIRASLSIASSLADLPD